MPIHFRGLFFKKFLEKNDQNEKRIPSNSSNIGVAAKSVERIYEGDCGASDDEALDQCQYYPPTSQSALCNTLPNIRRASDRMISVRAPRNHPALLFTSTSGLSSCGSFLPFRILSQKVKTTRKNGATREWKKSSRWSHYGTPLSVSLNGWLAIRNAHENTALSLYF